MCYEKPGPRCSGHTRTNFRAAKAKLMEANEDLKVKTEALNEARTAEAEAALKASQEAHAQAVAELEDATEKYETSKENRAVAMEAYREAKKEYEASPEGIKKNRIRSANPELTAEQRAAARDAAMEGALRREEQKEAYAKKKDADAAVDAVTEKKIAELNATTPEERAQYIYDQTRMVRPAQQTAAYAHALFEASSNLDKNLDPSRYAWGRKMLAEWETMPPEDLAVLAGDDDEEVRLNAIRNPSLSKESLGRLAKDPNVTVRAAVAESRAKDLTGSELKAFLNDDEEVRKSLSHGSIDEPVQVALTRDKSENVRMMLARNTGLSSRVQSALVNDASPKVASTLATNQNLNPGVVRKLSAHPETNVRVALAKNQSIPAQERENMGADKAPEVRSVLARDTSNPAMITHFSDDGSVNVRRSVGSNKNLTKEHVEVLLNDKETSVVAAVASNRVVSANQLRSLAERIQFRADRSLKEAIASNPNCSEALRKRLYNG